MRVGLELDFFWMDCINVSVGKSGQWIAGCFLDGRLDVDCSVVSRNSNFSIYKYMSLRLATRVLGENIGESVSYYIRL